MSPDALRKPEWLKVKLQTNAAFGHVNDLLSRQNLNTVCAEAACPNIHECWSQGTATFMILGDTCTRSCAFCNVKTGKSSWVDPDEARRVATSVKNMNLKHAVITSVNRDELIHGGAEIFAATIDEIRKIKKDCQVEVLIPDFKGSSRALAIVLNALPDVLGHNLETVPRLYGEARPQADYQQSLDLIRKVSEAKIVSKSGLMLGLGENFEEVLDVMKDLRSANCRILTLGQYLRPTRKHLPVKRYVAPKDFEDYAKIGMDMGFDHVESGPLVRSSYHAREQAEAQKKNKH
jgi:lipoic acid synthetase